MTNSILRLQGVNEVLIFTVFKSCAKIMRTRAPRNAAISILKNKSFPHHPQFLNPAQLQDEILKTSDEMEINEKYISS